MHQAITHTSISAAFTKEPFSFESDCLKAAELRLKTILNKKTQDICTAP